MPDGRRNLHRTLWLFATMWAVVSVCDTNVAAQSVSNCDRALGEAYLDVSNVRARILNTGGLWYRGEPHVYEVPKGSGSNAIFAGGIWIAGMVDGQLRASATRYGEWEMWAGPLDDDGNPPADCSVYDRVYSVKRLEIDEYDITGTATSDLADWPTGLGAPTYDAAGDLISLLDEPLGSRIDRVIDLSAGERPAIIGDQSLWWVMNDRGNNHTSSDTVPIGLEVHAMAFAFIDTGDIGHTTFYKYDLFYKGTGSFTEAYFGLFVDPDLGNFDDDWIGSDSLIGLGYVYNADNDDDGQDGYGQSPPAVGFDFIQGPVVPSYGDSVYVGGEIVHNYKALQMTTFAFFNGAGGVQAGPMNAKGYYNYMRGNWLDGRSITWGGNGRDFSEIPTNFMFSGDPVANTCWTERNSDCQGRAIESGDRRFSLSTGPFEMAAGDHQQIVIAVVFGQGTDNFDSVRALKEADDHVQSAFDRGFLRPEPLTAPDISLSIFDSGATITWTNGPDSNNYLESYREFDSFSPGDHQHVEFEGYQVLKFADSQDRAGEVIATYDLANGITQVVDVQNPGAESPLNDVTYLSAEGSDSGVQHAHTLQGLINTKTYYYGVRAYAYNAATVPKIWFGDVSRLEVIPRRSEHTYSAAAIEAALTDSTPDFVAEATAVGSGRVTADVVDPGAIIENATYTTQFYDFEGGVSYDITRSDVTGTVTLFDGRATGNPAPLKENLILIDGLQFTVLGAVPGMRGFKMIANANGILEPPDMAAFAFSSSGFPTVEGRDRPESGRGQSTNASTWGVHVGGGSGPYGNEAGPFNTGTTWVGRSVREGSELNPWPNVGSDDYEWRFPQSCFDTINGSVTQADCVSYRGFGDGELVEVPFQLWSAGTTSDPSDDYRMIPLICESECDGTGTDDVFDIAGDHPISGGDDDPYSDWIYWYKPEDNGASPGDAGYTDFFWGRAGDGDRVFSRQILVNWNGGNAPPYNADMLEPGSIIQYNTKKPNQPGDTFTFNTAGYGIIPASDSLKKSRLADINVVPNPYLLASAYEKQLYQDEVRFSNLPREEPATLRIFTLHGQLIQTLIKPSGVNQLSWDLKTSAALPIGSGIYLIHVEVEGIGTHVIKFAAILKRTVVTTN